MYIQTLFGPEKLKKVCNTCDEEKELEEFYVIPYHDNESPKRRTQCKACWNKHNGRTHFANVAMFEVRK